MKKCNRGHESAREPGNRILRMRTAAEAGLADARTPHRAVDG